MQGLTADDPDEVAGEPEVCADPLDLAAIFDRYGAELLRYCARRVGPDQAEDVVAATFLAAFAQRPTRSGLSEE